MHSFSSRSSASLRKRKREGKTLNPPLDITYTKHSKAVDIRIITAMICPSESANIERSLAKGHVTFWHDAARRLRFFWTYLFYVAIFWIMYYEIGEIGTREPSSSALELRGLSRGRPAIWIQRARHILAAPGHVRGNPNPLKRLQIFDPQNISMGWNKKKWLFNTFAEILHPADLNSSMESLSYDSSVASPGSSSGRHSQRTKRMRTSFKHHQLRTMKSYFAINQNPDAKDLKQLAQKTGLSKRVLQVRIVFYFFQRVRSMMSFGIK